MVLKTHYGSFPIPNTARTPADVRHRIGIDAEFILPMIDVNPISDMVVLSGSIIEGFGNCFSDLDVYVITPSERRMRGDTFLWAEADLWVDVEQLSDTRIKALVSRFSRVQDRFPGWEGHQSPSLAEQGLYHRLSMAVPIGIPLNGHRRGLSESFDPIALRQEVAYTALVGARARWIDGVGARLSAHYGQAMAFASMSLDCIVDAYTAMQGQPNPAAKWRLAKLHALRRGGLDDFGLVSFLRWFNRIRSESRGAADLRLKAVAVLMFFVMQRFFGTAAISAPAAPLGVDQRLEWLPDGAFIISALESARRCDERCVKRIRNPASYLAKTFGFQS